MQRRFEEGKYSVGYSTFLGYDKGKDGKPVINPEQAKTVRYIFIRFLEGKTPYSIAKELMEKGMRTGAGNAKWSTEGVVRILQNEKYCGNAILQKTYKRDLLSKRITNNGKVRKYLVENGHEAIITPSLIWGSGTLLVSLELVVALPYHTEVLIDGVPDLGAKETAAVTAYQLRGEYGL